jgi:hypothetical protein
VGRICREAVRETRGIIAEPTKIKKTCAVRRTTVMDGCVEVPSGQGISGRAGMDYMHDFHHSSFIERCSGE